VRFRTNIATVYSPFNRRRYIQGGRSRVNRTIVWTRLQQPVESVSVKSSKGERNVVAISDHSF
jgi:hypothetical protein